jgi:hypothetical protein|tara:strand:+ start:599 stop:1246 length:648 start_codon:yes stop_codon:yes gene_type:complete
MRPYDLIYFIGDSYTFAIGQADDLLSEVNVDNRFSQLVADHYKLEHVNHAEAGTSNQFIARTLQDNMIEYSLQDKNPLVIVSYTDSAREEVWDKEEKRPQTVWDKMSWYKDWITDGFDFEFQDKVTQYHINSSRFLLKYLKFDFVELYTTVYGSRGSTYGLPCFTQEEIIDLSIVEIGAPDGCFPGLHGSAGHLNITGHKLATDVLIKKIDKLYG